jgi:hypothetical protein
MNRYITFPCTIAVYIYDENSFYKPMSPYKSHITLEKAISHQQKKYPKNKIEVIKK